MSVISFLKHLIQKLFFMYTWNIVVLLIVMLLISVLYLILKRKIVNKKITNIVFLVSFAIYFALMIYSTLIDRSSETESAGLCLIPFYSYYQLFNHFPYNSAPGGKNKLAKLIIPYDISKCHLSVFSFRFG